MRFPTAAPTLLALLGAAAAAASDAASWTFSDASVKVYPKAKSAIVHKFTGTERIKEAVTLGHEDSLKVSLTALEGSNAKRPHQAFLVIKETSSGVEIPFALELKKSGKGSVQIAHKDLPARLLLSAAPLRASLVIGGGGSTKSSVTPVFDIVPKLDANSAAPSRKAEPRFGRLADIDHVFRGDPKTPPKMASLVFSLAVLASVPALFVGWLLLGANVGRAPKVLGSAPVSHAVFLGSAVAMECVFLLYYKGWNLFQTLPAMGLVGAAAFLSGTKALGEVQRRRVGGRR